MVLLKPQFTVQTSSDLGFLIGFLEVGRHFARESIACKVNGRSKNGAKLGRVYLVSTSHLLAQPRHPQGVRALEPKSNHKVKYLSKIPTPPPSKILPSPPTLGIIKGLMKKKADSADLFVSKKSKPSSISHHLKNWLPPQTP